MCQFLAIFSLTFALTWLRGTIGGPSPFQPGRVGHWSFVHFKGRDLSGYGNNVNREGTTDFDGQNGLFFPSGSNQSWAEIRNVNKDVKDLGKYSGFSVFGYVRYTGNRGPFSIVDFRANDYGLRIWGDANTSVWLNLGAYSKDVTLKQAAGFPNMTLLPGKKRHFGVSYNKASGKVVGFMNGDHQEITIDKNISAYTNVGKIYFGHQQGDHHAFKGHMYCMMFYQMALTAEQFLKLIDRCDINEVSQTEQVDVDNNCDGVTEAFSVIEPGVPVNGVFDHCNTTLEIKEGAITNETVSPNSFLVNEASEILLTKLTPGAFYRVGVQCVFGGFKGEALASKWFQTELDTVKSTFVNIHHITLNSAKVTWKTVRGKFDSFYVTIHPTEGGANAIPESVNFGRTLSATFQNLSSSTAYTVKITTSLGEKRSKGQCDKDFTTPDIPAKDSIDHTPIEIIVGSVAAILAIAMIILIIVLRYKRNRNAGSRGQASGGAAATQEERDTMVNPGPLVSETRM